MFNSDEDQHKKSKHPGDPDSQEQMDQQREKGKRGVGPDAFFESPKWKHFLDNNIDKNDLPPSWIYPPGAAAPSGEEADKLKESLSQSIQMAVRAMSDLLTGCTEVVHKSGGAVPYAYVLALADGLSRVVAQKAEAARRKYGEQAFDVEAKLFADEMAKGILDNWNSDVTWSYDFIQNKAKQMQVLAARQDPAIMAGFKAHIRERLKNKLPDDMPEGLKDAIIGMLAEAKADGEAFGNQLEGVEIGVMPAGAIKQMLMQKLKNLANGGTHDDDDDGDDKDADADLDRFLSEN